jgi:hypothetical protein
MIYAYGGSRSEDEEAAAEAHKVVEREDEESEFSDDERVGIDCVDDDDGGVEFLDTRIEDKEEIKCSSFIFIYNEW